MEFELITKDLPLEEIQRIVGNNSGVYLIHFDKPLAHAHHYLGYSSKLSERLEIHEKGGSDSSALMKSITAQGITWRVVHVWVGKNWLFEKELKRMAKVKCLEMLLCMEMLVCMEMLMCLDMLMCLEMLM